MNIFENFNLNRFLFSLQYMWKGMLCIFIVIAVIILSVVIMNKVTDGIAAAKERKEQQNSESDSTESKNPL